MSKLKPRSESSRSLAARVRSLTQLRILGPIGFLTLLGAFVWQLSDHPEWFQVNTEQPNVADTALSRELSDEERAIAAEIDSSNFLLKELEANSPQLNPLNDPILAGNDLLKAVRQSRNNSASSEATNVFLPEFSTSEQSAATPPAPNFSFSQNRQSSQTLSSFGTQLGSTPNSQSNLNSSFNLLSPQTESDSEEESTAKTPLQAAMEQYNQYNQDPSAVDGNDLGQTRTTATENTNSSEIGVNSREITSDNSASSLQLNLGTNSIQTLPTATTPTIPQPSWIVPRTPTQTSTSTPTVESIPIPNPYQTNLSIPRNLPLTQPTIPTIPSSSNPYGQLPSTVNPNPVYGFNNPNSVPNYGVVQPNIQNTTVSPNPLVPQTSRNLTPSTQPFSVPRPIPGRTIGGGRINTFANP